MGLLRFARNDEGCGNDGVFGNFNGITGILMGLLPLFSKPRNDGVVAMTG